MYDGQGLCERLKALMRQLQMGEILKAKDPKTMFCWPLRITVINSTGIGTGSFLLNLSLRSFTRRRKTMATRAVTKAPTLVCGNLEQISTRVCREREKKQRKGNNCV